MTRHRAQFANRRRSTSRVFLGACIVIQATACDQMLSVRRHETQALTPAFVDRIFSAATNVLVLNQGPGDTTCPVGFSRLEPDVRTFKQPNEAGVINDANDYVVTEELTGYFKVVNELNFCGRIGSFNGCSRNMGSIIVRRRNTEVLE